MNPVLVVEDNESVADAIGRAVERHLPMRRARGVRDALRLTREPGVTFQAAIIDVGLADGNGFDLARSLRRMQPDLPLLIITGQITPDVANQAQLAGAHFAYKPLNITDIDAFLLRALSDAPEARLQRAIDALAEATELSPREADIVRMTVAGVPRAKLPRALGVAESTIKTQVRCVLTKTNEISLDAVARRVLAAALAKR